MSKDGLNAHNNSLTTVNAFKAMSLTLLLCLLCICPSVAQHKTVTTDKMIGIGYNSIQDTYLSPEEYSGPELRYLSHTLRESDTCRWSRLIINEGYVSQGKSRSKNGAMIGGAYHFQYGALLDVCSYGSSASKGGSLRVGGQAEFLGGFIYNTRNGNNPAQMRALVDIGPVLTADYAFSRSFKLTYEASCPLLGITFSPNYGQSYYELFSEGHYDHNIVPTTIISTPSLRHQLSASFSFSRLSFSLGYLGDYRQQDVNNLKQHSYSSMLMIGIKNEF